MTRLVASFFSIALITGCQMAMSMSAPAELDARLASLERSRASEAGAASPSLFTADYRQPSHVWANRAPSMRDVRQSTATAVRTDARESGRDSLDPTSFESLTLGDAGDMPYQDAPDGGGAGKDDSKPKFERDRPLPSFADTVVRDVKAMPHDLWRDTKRVYANPVNLVILGSAYAGSLAIQESGPDSTVEHHFNREHDWQAPHHTFKEDWRDAFAAAGNPGTHFALAGLWYLIGQQSMDDKTYEVGKTLFSALAINGVTVMLGQAATYDRAPNGERGTFPSGHTSSAFVFASVMHEAYGHVVGVPLYALATLVGYERLDDREHYFSDVCMGAVLGTVIGHSVASGRDPEFFGWKVLPLASPTTGSGVAFVKTFE